MEAFAKAKANFRIQLRADEVRTLLGTPDPDTDIDSALDQLVEWGNLERTHDTGRVSNLADFYRRHFVYRITAAGEAAESAVGAVIAALESSGSLQRVMLGSILRNLELLVAQVTGSAEPDVSIVHEAVFNVTRQFEALAENASTFMGRLHEVIESSEVETSAFIAYKQDIIAYLQDFIGELGRVVPQICRCLNDLDAYGLSKAAALAAQADEAPDLGIQRDIALEFDNRLRGICRWFLSDGQEPPTIDLLRRTARDAINRILRVLERIHESRFRRVNHTADLLCIARWISDCASDDQAQLLFQRAFGFVCVSSPLRATR